MTTEKVFCPSCNTHHRAKTGELDADGFPITEWLEDHTPAPIEAPPESPELEEARDRLAREAGAALGIAFDVGSWARVEEVLDQVFDGAPPEEDQGDRA